MKENLWKTIFISDFDNNKYLYHYTNVDKALKILTSNSLRFSRIDYTNDTSESKLKINFEKPDFNVESEIKEFDKKTEKILDFFNRKNPLIRLLCFSMDVKYSKADIQSIYNKQHLTSKDKYYNVLGRGFALPRMWAQYASDNKGVCLIIDKEKLLDKVDKQLEFHKESSVKYKKFFANYYII